MMELIRDQAVRTEACGFGNVPAQGLKTVRLAPDGKVESENGAFVIDDVSAGMIVAELKRHGVLVPIDWEHSTMKGGVAPAAGWIHKVWREAGRGLMALVEWTEEAATMIRKGQYRYISPVFSVRKDDRRVAALHSAAITNKPAIPRMERLAASASRLTTEMVTMAEKPSEGPAGDPGMLVAEIAALLGIDTEDGGDVGAILRAIRNWARDNRSKASGEEEEAENVFESAQREVEALRITLAERDADDLMRPYLAAHKINPADTEDMVECRELAMRAPARFKHHMARRQPLVAPGRTTPPGGFSPRSNASRNSTVHIAMNAYRESTELQKTTSLVAYVNNELREREFGKLTEDEATTMSCQKA